MPLKKKTQVIKTKQNLKNKTKPNKKQTLEEERKHIQEVRQQHIKQVKTWKKRKGRTELIDILSNKNTSSLKKAVLATCYACICGGDNSDDLDCKGYTCPLYTFNPWQKVLIRQKKTKIITDEQRQEMSERMKKMQQARKEKNNV